MERPSLHYTKAYPFIMRYLVIRLTKLNSKHLTCIAAAHITSWTGWRITKNWRQRWVTEMELQFAVPSSAEVNEKVNVPTSTHHAARLLLMARHCTCSSWFSEKRAFHKQRVSESEWRESWKRPSFWGEMNSPCIITDRSLFCVSWRLPMRENLPSY